MATVVVLEDESAIREVVVEYLQQSGHQAIGVASGTEALDLVQRSQFDLCILDVRVPGGGGFHVAREIRRSHPTVPIIFLTARDDETSRITGFEIGADDYVSKPFSPRELMFRVEAVLRRGGKELPPGPGRLAKVYRICLDGSMLTLDEPRHQIRVDEKGVSLTLTEWRILETLVHRIGLIVDREDLVTSVLGYDAQANSRSIDTHIKNLRNKLDSRRWIATERGLGYRLLGTLCEGTP